MPPYKTRVLVTGATGFLGRHTLHALSKREDVQVIAACREPARLDPTFAGSVRVGDLLDAGYRREVSEGVDVVCHTGTWGAFFGHAKAERSHFFEPTMDLLHRLLEHGGSRFILASSVAVAAPSTGAPIDDFAPSHATGFWPHLDYLIEVDHAMQSLAGPGHSMVNLRLGHFVGPGNRLGLVPALVPRLKTRLVPWLGRADSRLPLVAGPDLGQAFALAATANSLNDYESFIIQGPEAPTTRQLFEFIATRAGVPLPWFSVPFWAGYAFGWLMEALYPLLPGPAPFLTRSLVHVAENWHSTSEYAHTKLGFAPHVSWQSAVGDAIQELEAEGFPWPRLAQQVQ